MNGDPADFGTEVALPRRRVPGKLDFALPTINIIFLLTLYFLLAGTLASHNEVTDNLPQTVRTATERLPRPLMTVQEDGSFLIDGKVVAPADLVSGAQAVVAARPGSMLNVVVAGPTQAQPLFSLLAELSAAGVPVRIVTERATAELPP